MKKKLTIIITLSIFIGSLLLADNVVLKDGTSVEGQITKESNTHITIIGNDYLERTIPKISISEVKYTYKANNDKYSQYSREKEDAYSSGTIKSNNKKLRFAFFAGYNFFTEEAIKDIYGSSLLLGAEVAFMKKSGFGWSLRLERMNQSGNPIVIDPENIIDKATCELSVLPITFNGIYNIDNTTSDFQLYFGAGGGLFLVNEKMKIITDYGNYSNSTNKQIFGFQVLGGVKINILMIEAKFSSATFSGGEGAAGDEVNVGGFAILCGFRF